MMKECPYCAEEIQLEATKCRYCKEWLDDDEYDDDEYDDDEYDDDEDDEYDDEYDSEEDQKNNFWGTIFVVLIAGLFIYNYIISPNLSKSSSNYYKYSSGERIGAICDDGTRSNATGSGACSYHGGVCYWIYDEAPLFRPGPQCPDFP